jgi:hypothetical protein
MTWGVEESGSAAKKRIVLTIQVIVSGGRPKKRIITTIRVVETSQITIESIVGTYIDFSGISANKKIACA